MSPSGRPGSRDPPPLARLARNQPEFAWTVVGLLDLIRSDAQVVRIFRQFINHVNIESSGLHFVKRAHTTNPLSVGEFHDHGRMRIGRRKMKRSSGVIVYHALRHGGRAGAHIYDARVGIEISEIKVNDVLKSRRAVTMADASDVPLSRREFFE